MNALTPHSRILRVLPFIVLWLIGLALCAQFNWVTQPTDAVDEITEVAAVLNGLPWLSAETIFLYIILRPGSFRWSWGRGLIALAAMAPWAYYNSVPAWRPARFWSGWEFAHGYWLLGVTGLLIIVFLVSLVGALLRSKRASTTSVS